MIKFSNIQSIGELRDFVKAFPSHPIAPAMEEMLFDMDEFGEKYTLEDFREEANAQMFKRAGGLAVDDVRG